MAKSSMLGAQAPESNDLKPFGSAPGSSRVAAPENEITADPEKILLSLIDDNPYQHRTEAFDGNGEIVIDDKLKELAASIASQGVLQPILVRKHGDRYQLAAGHRRVRASRIAGLEKIPAIIKLLDEQQMLIICFIENFQRENLSAYEEFQGILRAESLGIQRDAFLKETGMSTTLYYRLLAFKKLPAPVLAAISKGISLGSHTIEKLATIFNQDGLNQVIINDKIELFLELLEPVRTGDVTQKELIDRVQKKSQLESKNTRNLVDLSPLLLGPEQHKVGRIKWDTTCTNITIPVISEEKRTQFQVEIIELIKRYS